MKRLFDIISSLCVLSVLAVPMLVIAIAIKLTSPGPVFYWSNRVGRNNAIFKMPKYRSMRIDTRTTLTRVRRAVLQLAAWLAITAWLALGGGCSGLEVDLEGRACDGGECIAGYVCHPESGDCVTEIVIDGSFVEDKDHPNDIDGYFECDLMELATGRLQAALNALDPFKVWTWDPAARRPCRGYPKRQLPMWHTYRVELYPHYGQLSGIRDRYGHELEFPSAFRLSRRTGAARGVVKLT